MEKKSNLSAEVFAGIIIGVFVLAIVILGITRLISYSSEVQEVYRAEGDILSLTQSSQIILENTDTSQIMDSETFFLQKDKTGKDFLVLTGALHENKKYINHLGENIPSPENYPGNIYERSLEVSTLPHSLGGETKKFSIDIQKYIKK